MTFAELTWNPDQWNDETQSHWGWQAQYEADNGYLIVANTQLGETPLASATESGQKYSVVIFSWDRAEGVSSPIFNEADCTNNRVSTLIDQTVAYAQPDAEEDPNDTTTTTASPDGQGD